MEHLKYPIGKRQINPSITFTEIQSNIAEMEKLPSLLKQTASKLSAEQLDMPYRPDSWTARQVIHHIADSHMNALTRIKLTLTENNPTIKPYKQDLWAHLPDTSLPIETAITFIELLHQKMVVLLKALKENDFKKTYVHPEDNKTYTLADLTSIYAWHGKHHVSHLQIILNS